MTLCSEERQAVLDILHSEQFCDDAPYQIYAKLLDQGRYICSIRTMYRILETEHGFVKERRKHVQRPIFAKPELLVTTTQAGMVVGYYQVQGNHEMDLFSPVRDS